MKIKMLTDEVLSNVIENGENKGPKRCLAGEAVEVWDGVGEMLIKWGRAEKASKHTEQQIATKEPVKEEKTKKSKK